MVLYGPKKWGMSKDVPLGYRALGDLFKNVNGSSIRVLDQRLCLPEVGLPFLDSSNFTPTSDVFSRTFYFGGGCQMEYSRMYS